MCLFKQCQTPLERLQIDKLSLRTPSHNDLYTYIYSENKRKGLQSSLHWSLHRDSHGLRAVSLLTQEAPSKGRIETPVLELTKLLSNSARLTPAVNAEVGEGVVLDVVFSSQFPTPETGYGAWAPGEHQHTKPASPSKQARSCALVNHLGDLSECDTRATKRNAEIRGVITTVAQSSGPLPQRMLPLHLLCPAVYDLWWHLVLWIPWFWSGVVLLRWHTCGLRRIRRSWRLSSWSIVHLWGNRFLILLIRVTARHLVRWLIEQELPLRLIQMTKNFREGVVLCADGEEP